MVEQMKKNFIIIILCLCILKGTLYAEDEGISVAVNDKLILKEQGQVELIKGVAYISLEFLEPALHIDMFWMKDIGQVQLNKDEKIMILNLQNQTLTADWLKAEGSAIVTKNNDIMVPVRQVAEYFGYQVHFKSQDAVIHITSSENTQGPIQQDKKLPKVLYLTFDDGPSAYTDKLLEVLDKYQVKATFFMLDGAMKKNPESVKHIVERGHAVGLHGVTHKPQTFYCGIDGPLKEMNQTNDTLESIVGFRSCLIRTPFGSNPHLTQKQYLNLVSNEYRIWDWNIDSKDWAYNNPQKAFITTVKNMKTSKKEPKVVLFHDMKYVAETLELFLKWMEENEYTSKEITPDLIPVKMTQKK